MYSGPSKPGDWGHHIQICKECGKEVDMTSPEVKSTIWKIYPVTYPKNTKKIWTITSLKVIASILLLWAIIDNPYAYYQFLRFAVTGIAIYIAILAYNTKNVLWTWIMVGIAVLFNPIIPFYIEKEAWAFFDFIGAIIFLLSIWFVKDE